MAGKRLNPKSKTFRKLVNHYLFELENYEYAKEVKIAVQTCPHEPKFEDSMHRLDKYIDKRHKELKSENIRIRENGYSLWQVRAEAMRLYQSRIERYDDYARCYVTTLLSYWWDGATGTRHYDLNGHVSYAFDD